ncbi:MAG TPA: cupin domain-containing protein [Saprospiraceae bacterium]|nr:cupin domain-containing protein [Saprospiraceae bacterium]MCB9271174.1 cupin domain-containing protein [Lewinellaceae bacterium]HPG09784.1 cupin domain-containing protein [Saprospiraceae bacterium]HRV87419.1 cupin domain-containing protein [Saprospiraceae bacterium]
MSVLFRADDRGEFFTREQCHILEIMNTPERDNLSIAQARVEPGVTTELHGLDVVEAYYILEGLGRVNINGMEHLVAAGDVVLIPAGQAQQITNTGISDLRFLCICTPRFHPESYTAMAPE